MYSLDEALPADGPGLLVLHEVSPRVQAGGAQPAGEAHGVEGGVQGGDQLIQDGQPTGLTPGLGQPPAVSTAPPDMTHMTHMIHRRLTLTPRPPGCRTGQ